MKSLFHNLRHHPYSLFGKAQLRPAVALAGLALAALLANIFPENILGGAVAAVVIGFIVAGFAPWWRADNQQGAGLPYCLYPRIRMLAAAEARLLIFIVGLLAIGYVVLDSNRDAAYGCLLGAVSMGSALASGRLPVWRNWPTTPQR